MSVYSDDLDQVPCGAGGRWMYADTTHDFYIDSGDSTISLHKIFVLVRAKHDAVPWKLLPRITVDPAWQPGLEEFQHAVYYSRPPVNHFEIVRNIWDLLELENCEDVNRFWAHPEVYSTTTAVNESVLYRRWARHLGLNVPQYSAYLARPPAHRFAPPLMDYDVVTNWMSPYEGMTEEQRTSTRTIADYPHYPRGPLLEAVPWAAACSNEINWATEQIRQMRKIGGRWTVPATGIDPTRRVSKVLFYEPSLRTNPDRTTEDSILFRSDKFFLALLQHLFNVKISLDRDNVAQVPLHNWRMVEISGLAHQVAKVHGWLMHDIVKVASIQTLRAFPVASRRVEMDRPYVPICLPEHLPSDHFDFLPSYCRYPDCWETGHVSGVCPSKPGLPPIIMQTTQRVADSFIFFHHRLTFMRRFRMLDENRFWLEPADPLVSVLVNRGPLAFPTPERYYEALRAYLQERRYTSVLRYYAQKGGGAGEVLQTPAQLRAQELVERLVFGRSYDPPVRARPRRWPADFVWFQELQHGNEMNIIAPAANNADNAADGPADVPEVNEDEPAAAEPMQNAWVEEVDDDDDGGAIPGDVQNEALLNVEDEDDDGGAIPGDVQDEAMLNVEEEDAVVLEEPPQQLPLPNDPEIQHDEEGHGDAAGDDENNPDGALQHNIDHEAHEAEQ